MTPDDKPAPPRWSLPALLLAVVAVYAVVLPAGFIEYDDAWLVVESPLARAPTPDALRRAWTSFDLRTRLILGAEYLPARDTVTWLVARLAGPSPQAFHLTQLAVYLGAIALLRRWLRAVWPRPLAAEVALWLFALHPAHVSSVAWIAGMKDVLSLLALGAALDAYARGARLVASRVALFTALACLSKGTSIIAPALLLSGDLLASRRPRWGAVAASSIVCAASLAAQLRVGAVVQMIAEPLGHNVIERINSMSPVFWRYLAVSALLDPPCIVRLVPRRGAGDAVGLLALAGLVALAALVAHRWRRGDRVSPFALLVFALGLAPVSQVLIPLQNRMADRYLLVAVLGPCALFAAACARAPMRPARWVVVAAALALASASSARHAWEFADASRLWRSAMRRVPESGLAPYQLALRHDHAAGRREAEALYREALRRDGLRTDISPRAAANLSRILATTGRADEAVALLSEVVARFPRHPRPINNLAVLRFARGERDAARALFLRLVREFPDYPRGRAGYEARFGRLPARAERRDEDGWRFDPYGH